MTDQLLGGVGAWGTCDTTAWMGASAREEEAIDWRLVAADAVERAPLGKLVEALIYVHSVAAGCTPVALQVGWRNELARHDVPADPWGNRFEHRNGAIGERLARVGGPTTL
jgi:hypothetical protein